MNLIYFTPTNFILICDNTFRRRLKKYIFKKGCCKTIKVVYASGRGEIIIKTL